MAFPACLFGLGASPRPRRPARRPARRPDVEGLDRRCLLDAGIGFVQTNLASDIAGLAAHTDPNLINPWGFSETPQGQFRVSANGTGDALLLNARGATLGQPVVIPPPMGSPPGTTSTPNGNLVNTTNDFVISHGNRSAPATVLFSTEDGTIAGWNPRVDRTEAVIGADRSGAGAVYKLLTMASTPEGNRLFATNFHSGKVDVFDAQFHLVNSFTEPNAPAGFAPFGIKNLDGILFVTYAKQDDPSDAHDDVAGPGNGFIDEFSTSGQFLGRFASGTAVGGTLTALNSPIGATVAPPGYGPDGRFSNALLIGNFGDSHVSAFDPKTGAFLGQLSDAQGHPLTLNGGFGGSDTKGLWGIGFGNGHGGADPNTLFFASGIGDEDHGLFGKVTMTDGDHDRDDGERTGDDHDRGPDLFDAALRDRLDDPGPFAMTSGARFDDGHPSGERTHGGHRKS